MKTKKTNTFNGLVYSTSPEAMKQEEPDNIFTPEPGNQRLSVILDSKGRKGKIVTLITGFEGDETGLLELGKKLKVKCGAGGSVKDGEIIIQGDYKIAVIKWLKEWGFQAR